MTAPILETRRPRPGLAGSALTAGRTTCSGPLGRAPGMSSRSSPAACRARGSESGRNPRGPQDGRREAGGSGCGVSASTEPSSLSLPICKWPGRAGADEGTGPHGNPKGGRGQVLQGLHWIESSVLLVEGFTGHQTEDTLRTVDAKPGRPEPVRRPGSDPPLPGSSPALPTRPGLSPADPSLSLCCTAHARGPGEGAAQAQTHPDPHGGL